MTTLIVADRLLGFGFKLPRFSLYKALNNRSPVLLMVYLILSFVGYKNEQYTFPPIISVKTIGILHLILSDRINNVTEI